MKIFWWQGGLHAEPETAEEGAAMRLLSDAVRSTSIGAGNNMGPKSVVVGSVLATGTDQQTSEDLIANK